MPFSYNPLSGEFDFLTTGAVTTTISFATDSGTAIPASNIITLAGGEGIDTSATGSTVTIAGEDATDTNKGIASFIAADFSVSSGAVSLVDTVVKSIASDSGSATPSSHAFTIAGAGTVSTSATGATVTITGTAFPETFDDSTFRIFDNVDNTKEIAFQASGITTSTTRTITMADQNIDLTPTTGSFQASDADLTAISALSGSGVVTRTGASTWATNSIADRAVVVGDTGNTVQGIGPLSNGQLLIGSTGSVPVAASLTPGTGIDVTSGAGSITVDFDVTEVVTIPTSFPTDSGTAISTANAITFTATGGASVSALGSTITIDSAAGTVTSVSGTLNRISSTGGATPVIDIDAAYVGQTSITTLGTISTGTWSATDIAVDAGGTGRSSHTAYAVICGGTTGTGAQQSIAGVGTSGQVLTSNGAGALPTFQDAGGGGITWSEETGTSATLVVDTGVIANNASLVTLTLPSTAAQGTVFRVSAKGAGLVRIAQQASQVIHFGSSDTTTGTGGYIQATDTGDAVELLTITANTNFQVLSASGSWTIV